MTNSSRWSIFTHKDTEKSQKNQIFEIDLNRLESDSRVVLAKIRRLLSLKLEISGMGTGLNTEHKFFYLTATVFQSVKKLLELILFVLSSKTQKVGFLR